MSSRGIRARRHNHHVASDCLVLSRADVGRAVPKYPQQGRATRAGKHRGAQDGQGQDDWPPLAVEGAGRNTNAWIWRLKDELSSNEENEINDLDERK
jgi:hypothetical protein